MLTRWTDRGLGPDDPLAVLEAFRREMNRMATDHDHGLATPARLATRGTWPRVDLFDTGSDLLVRAELPGVDKDDVEITVHEATLTLKGKRSDDLLAVVRGDRPKRKQR